MLVARVQPPSNFEIHTTPQGSYILKRDERELDGTPAFDSIQDAIRHATGLPDAIGQNVKVFDEDGRAYLTILISLPRGRRL